MLTTINRRWLLFPAIPKRPLKTVCSLRTLSKNGSIHTMSPTQPRRSASLVVVTPQNEVLLVHRNPNSQSYAGAHVFPGGNYDEAQDDSLEMTAIREAFEETGLLLASPSTPDPLSNSPPPYPTNAELDEAREAIHSQRMRFIDFLGAHNLIPHCTSLLPFTQWVTPPNLRRRFDTRFYLTFLQAAPSTGFSEGLKRDLLPTPDGGQEVIAVRFVHPARALTESQAHTIALMPPQVYILTTLADILEGECNTEAQRGHLTQLAKGTYGNMVIQPQQLPERDEDGFTIMAYEGDEARGGQKGRLHRCRVKFDKRGVATEVILQRNFDVFTELATVLNTAKSSL